MFTINAYSYGDHYEIIISGEIHHNDHVEKVADYYTYGKDVVLTNCILDAIDRFAVKYGRQKPVELEVNEEFVKMLNRKMGVSA